MKKFIQKNHERIYTILALLYLSMVFLICSCNVTKDKVRQVAKVSRISEKDVVTEKVSEINTGVEWDYSDMDLSFRPVDETKPMIIVDPSGKKTSTTNAEIEYSRTTEKRKDTTSRIETTKSEDKSRSQEKIKLKTEEKHKKTRTDWKLYLFGIPVVVVLYFLIKWFRKKYPGII